MYNINFDKHLNLLNWSCIYWAIQEQLIEPENAVIYANKIVENNPEVDTPEIIELLIIDVAEKNNVLPLIERMFSNLNINFAIHHNLFFLICIRFIE